MVIVSGVEASLVIGTIYFEATFTKEVLAMINVNTSVRKPIGVIGFFLPREQTMYNLI